MAGTRAVIYIQADDVSAEKQIATCLEYAQRENLDIISVAPASALDEGLRLIRDGHADLMVLAYDDGPRSAEVSRAVRDVIGARIEYCRTRRRVPGELDTDELIVALYRRGVEASGIARLLGLALRRVRLVLVGRGIRPTKQ